MFENSCELAIKVKDQYNNIVSKITVDGKSIPAQEKVFTISEITVPFTDIPDVAWMKNVAEFSYRRNLIAGTTKTTFSPNTSMTRGQFVTILWRMEGCPTAKAANYKDVAAGSFYEKAVNWAAEKAILFGYSDGTFCGNKEITKEEVMTFLYRYANYKKLDVTARFFLSSS